MALPPIDDDQRVMAVAMLANALRAAGSRGRARAADAPGPLLGTADRRRTEAAERYVSGMVDLLAVLFAEGRPGAESLLADAAVLARGAPPRERGWG